MNHISNLKSFGKGVVRTLEAIYWEKGFANSYKTVYR